MKQTVTQYDFTEAFKEVRPDNFSYTALVELFDYLEQLEDDCGTEIELDVIAICCDFSELDIYEFMRDYGIEDDCDDPRDAVEKYLDHNGAWYAWVTESDPGAKWRILFNVNF